MKNKEAPIVKSLVGLGTIYYNSKGEWHNEAGPARIRPNGKKEYWIRDGCISEYEFTLKYGKKLGLYEEHYFVLISSDGSIEWCDSKYDNNGSFRYKILYKDPPSEERAGYRNYILDSGEVIENSEPGTSEYFVFIDKHKTKYWYQNVLHCSRGPAVEYANGSKEWWLCGEKLTKEEYYRKLNPELIYNI
jgi:hypothetical protein